ncbi:hypothetical protein AZF37_01165 [endosymbiont 'TC1' of Trimyema compressum]|uniref:HAD-IC family P-type ATPase n=1 Tax=endosymbiont 'TC1' of Trimyema compressum TaxID=243899 RepID=UPI0007F17624|nr:HAD-IC family P-type ATPase [endosymbiont 'TC1' of Trimyema compressum]AMP19976.1 hypothetical protein AZF37_01165 [endosymbiont 'TC1' of Trimyema compressum]
MSFKQDEALAKTHLEKQSALVDAGLTNEEVAIREERGEVNRILKAPTRTLWDIFRTNLFTFFNGLNIVLVVLVLIAGEPRNALFIIIVIANILIGIIQEYRAKKTIEKMSLLKNEQVHVLREGKEEVIPIDDVVIDDLVMLIPGMQLPADVIIVEAFGLEIDESLLTGESDSIEKQVEDCGYSGSFVVAGTGKAQVLRVGKETYINQLSHEAKRFKIVHSELRDSIDKIIKFLTLIIFPVALLLFISQFFIIKQTWNEAILKTVAGIIGMIPEGLVLLTSVAFAVGIICLATHRTLVQELPAIESLARVDVLCLDKTGTLTEGSLDVAKVITLDESFQKLNMALATYAYMSKDKNETSQALIDYYKNEVQLLWKITDRIPFSSTRKWASMTVDDGMTYIMGAPDILIEDKALLDKVEIFAKQGYRVLCFAITKETVTKNKHPRGLVIETLILLQDRIREEAKATLDYFKKQDVTLKIISGDNPTTVATVARRVGIHDHENYIDSRTLPEDPKDLEAIMENNTVFGRVTPQQKKEMVQALQRRGHIVGMTGDGVNDVLALKEADCGIAMASGSEASRAVAQLVLLDSNFAALPVAVTQGRRVINNIQRVASLFLVKSVYSIILSVFVTIFGFAYPFTPIQISLISTLAVGIPAFFLALEPNQERISGSFFSKILSIAIPGGITVSFSLLSINFLNMVTHLNFSPPEMATMLVLATGLIQLFVLAKISKPLNIWRIVLIGTMSLLFVACFFIPATISFFGLARLTWFLAFVAVLFTLTASLLVIVGEKILKRVFKKDNRV